MRLDCCCFEERLWHRAESGFDMLPLPKTSWLRLIYPNGCFLGYLTNGKQKDIWFRNEQRGSCAGNYLDVAYALDSLPADVKHINEARPAADVAPRPLGRGS